MSGINAYKCQKIKEQCEALYPFPNNSGKKKKISKIQKGKKIRSHCLVEFKK